MEKIAAKFIEYGFDFQYENYASDGEKLVCFDESIEITIQKGFIHFEHNGDTLRVEDNEFNMVRIVNAIERVFIEVTT